jgi:multidrug resistance efflux pump
VVFKQDFDDVAADSAAPIRYRTRPGVDFTTATDPKSGVHQFFAKDRASGDIYHLGQEEIFICQLLDGSRSLDEIQAAFKARFGLKLTHKQFSEFLRELHAAGFLAVAEAAGPAANAPADAGRADSAQPPTPFHFRLLDLSPLFRACAWLFRPARFLLWLLPPATLLAGLILFHRRVDIFVGHDIIAFTTASLLGAGLATLLATNLLSRIVQGSVAQAFGATIRDFGITFAFGVIPGFYIDRRPINLLPQRARVWCHAAPLLARLSFFAIGTFLWISLRPTASGLSEIAFFVGQVGFWSLLLSSIPFLPTDGYLLVASIFGRPDYMDRALRVVGMQVTGQPLPQALRARDKWLFILFAAAVVICIAAAVAGGILFFGVPLEDRYRGAGAAMVMVAVGLAMLWLFFSWRSIERLRAAAKAGVAAPPNVVALSAGGQAAARPAAAPYVAAGSASPSRTTRKPRRSLVPYFVWAAVLGALGVVAFLPYPYEAGGDFLVLPSTRVEVRARVDGEVLELLVKEGDRVEEGQPLARLSSWDEARDLAVAKASLEKSRAELQVLEDGPKPEDIKLAESQVAAANARITFSRAEADRESQLMKSGTSSKREAEHAWSEYKKDLADLAVAQANLEVVKSGPTDSMLAVAKADVSRLQEQVAYLEDQIERTEVRAPIAGRIVTSNLELQRGMYLTVGSLFAVIERSDIAQAEILVPETDIGEVAVGDGVRLKPWANSDLEIAGHVVSISPVAEKTPYGPVIHVKTEIDNADGFLRADMTGFAKLGGSTMPVWQAYTRFFVRFFNIEVWSWIP